MNHEISVGDIVFIYSTSLDEVIEGRVEGFVDDERLRVKVLQEISEGYLRHIVSWVYVFYTEEEANNLRNDYKSREVYSRSASTSWQSGMTVKLLNNGDYVVDSEGNPLVYQIISVYKESSQVSLATAYGELIGKYDWNSIVFHSNESLFRRSDYSIGQRVTWAESEDVYEGTIIGLYENRAKVTDIKKLYPLDYTRFIPYYKIPSDLRQDNKSQILTTVIGDNLEN